MHILLVALLTVLVSCGGDESSKKNVKRSDKDVRLEQAYLDVRSFWKDIYGKIPPTIEPMLIVPRYFGSEEETTASGVDLEKLVSYSLGEVKSSITDLKHFSLSNTDNGWNIQKREYLLASFGYTLLKISSRCRFSKAQLQLNAVVAEKDKSLDCLSNASNEDESRLCLKDFFAASETSAQQCEL